MQRALDLSFDAAVSDCRASLWIVLALFLGRKPERFWSIPQQVYGRTGSYGDYWRVTKKRIHLVSYLSLPDFDLDHVDRQLVEPVYNCLLLPIPASLTQSLSKALRSIWDKNVSTDELRSETKQRISQLNSEHNTRLTSNRLAAHLHRDLTQRGECDVVSKRIRGIDPQSNYKQRYEARNQDATQTVYRRYAITLLRSIGREGDWQDSQSKSTLFGSQIKVKDEAIRHLFDDLHQRMTAHKDPAREVIRYHNAYSMYVFQLLMLASGHRPVRVPLETMRSYDSISHELYICDKVAKRTNDSRTVVLPDVAVVQIERYRKHLETLEQHCQRLAPEVCSTVRSAIVGDAPLLFRLERTDSQETTSVSFDPKHVSRWLQEDWTLPRNWHRHWLRSKLAEQEQPHEYVDQFLGHENDQPAGFSRYSSLTYVGRHALAACIDSSLQSLGVVAVGGLR